jgi:putative addiction module killer protein
MIEVQQTDAFAKRLSALRHRQARIKILGRIARLAHGNPGDMQSVGDGVSELRIHSGPGYRVYFVRRGIYVVILLGGRIEENATTGHSSGQDTRRGFGGIAMAVHLTRFDAADLS